MWVVFKIKRRYCFTLYFVISTYPLSGRFPFSCPIPALYAKIPCYVFSTCSTARGAQVGGGGGVGSHGWCGGVPGLVRFFNQVVGLTCQPDSQFQIPVRIHFLQGTGGSSSVYHLWVGPYDRNYGSTIYPPPHLQKGSGSFCCHDSDQLREYNQGFPPYHSIYWEKNGENCFRWLW